MSNYQLVLQELEPILIYRGATSQIEIDLSDFDMQGGSVLFTIRNLSKTKVYFEQTFTTSEIHTVTFTDEFTVGLSASEYVYDIMHLLKDERFPQCKPSPVVVEGVVGSYHGT